MTDYQAIEDLLVQLLYFQKNVFDESESSEVQEFIDVGEYGLALDTFMDIVTEESKMISQDTLDLAKQSAVAMELDGEAVEERLIRFVAAVPSKVH